METAFAMKGGAGPASYSQNSTIQGSVSDQAKALTVKGIQQHIVLPPPDDDPVSMKNKTFRIADLGCSVGPNTLACVKTIMGAIEAKARGAGSEEAIEFQVFFNDQESSDFNTLFQILPKDRAYSIAGVPGSFYTRLFPWASMDVMNCNYALHWLSKVPEEVKRPDSPAWNKGKMTYCESAPEVVEAFRAQSRRDLEEFFKQRSIELVDNGILIIVMPCRTEGTQPSESYFIQGNELTLGHLLTDMAKEGLIDEALVDSFNFPMFIPTAAEVKEAALKTECFSVDEVEKLYLPMNLAWTIQQPDNVARTLRAVTEDLVKNHFGDATSDLIYARLPLKIKDMYAKTPPAESVGDVKKFEHLFILVRKTSHP